MPRLRLPLRLHVAEEPLEAGPEGVVGTGEGEDGRPEEGDDGDRRREDDLRVGILGALARTHLPLGQVPERGAERRRRDRGAAVASGERPLDLKPEVCWQLPLRRIDDVQDDGSVISTLTEFARAGWGEGGDDFAWWCTEAKEAFTGGEPVYKSMEAELRKMLGDAVYEEVAKYMDIRLTSGPPPVPHPAEVPVSLGRTRVRRP